MNKFSEEQKEMAMKHQKLDVERKTILQKLIEIGEEKREYTLVLETLEQLEERKCWRLINGILVEKTKAELCPDLKTNIENMDEIWKQLDDRSLEIRKEMQKIEEEIGQNIKDTKGDIHQESTGTKSAGGVLV